MNSVCLPRTRRDSLPIDTLMLLGSGTLRLILIFSFGKQERASLAFSYSYSALFFHFLTLSRFPPYSRCLARLVFFTPKYPIPGQANKAWVERRFGNCRLDFSFLRLARISAFRPRGKRQGKPAWPKGTHLPACLLPPTYPPSPLPPPPPSPPSPSICGCCLVSAGRQKKGGLVLSLERFVMQASYPTTHSLLPSFALPLACPPSPLISPFYPPVLSFVFRRKGLVGLWPYKC